MQHALKEDRRAGVADYLFAGLLYLLPHHLLSRIIFRITRIRRDVIKNAMIRSFVSVYKVDMSEAETADPTAYPTFNSFFTRSLKTGARIISGGAEDIAGPADGRLSQAGTIRNGRIFQAKGRDYSLEELLGGNPEWCERFRDGQFATIYLSPRDYHRVHAPVAGRLVQMTYVPGRLFSVSPSTTRVVPRLFSRNERVVCFFDTAAGPMAVILVGAIFVASVDTVWAGNITPSPHHALRHWHYGDQDVVLSRGQELGRFNMGSTVILLFARDRTNWIDTLAPEAHLRMGQCIGHLQTSRVPG
jgi:phosphatidylserine decarboxylase